MRFSDIAFIIGALCITSCRGLEPDPICPIELVAFDYTVRNDLDADVLLGLQITTRAKEAHGIFCVEDPHKIELQIEPFDNESLPLESYEEKVELVSYLGRRVSGNTTHIFSLYAFQDALTATSIVIGTDSVIRVLD